MKASSTHQPEHGNATNPLNLGIGTSVDLFEFEFEFEFELKLIVTMKLCWICRVSLHYYHHCYYHYCYYDYHDYNCCCCCCCCHDYLVLVWSPRLQARGPGAA